LGLIGLVFELFRELLGVLRAFKVKSPSGRKEAERGKQKWVLLTWNASGKS
jgi:hypothetical protein